MQQEDPQVSKWARFFAKYIYLPCNLRLNFYRLYDIYLAINHEQGNQFPLQETFIIIIIKENNLLESFRNYTEIWHCSRKMETFF